MSDHFWSVFFLSNLIWSKILTPIFICHLKYTTSLKHYEKGDLLQTSYSAEERLRDPYTYKALNVPRTRKWEVTPIPLLLSQVRKILRLVYT